MSFVHYFLSNLFEQKKAYDDVNSKNMFSFIFKFELKINN